MQIYKLLNTAQARLRLTRRNRLRIQFCLERMVRGKAPVTGGNMFSLSNGLLIMVS